MREAKTKPTSVPVELFIAAVGDDRKRADAFELLRMMQEITGEKPTLWGPSIIGFGSCHYTYESGREGDMPIVGFSPRKAATTLYLMGGFEHRADLLSKLGKHTTGKACLYIKKLSDVDLNVLRELIAESVRYMKQTNP